jgi:acetolactate synthase small subunit
MVNTFFKERQKQGDVAKVAFSTGYSESHVYNVIAGRRVNENITKQANKLVGRRKVK